MPSKNPRLSVVLTPSVAATLAALSSETGESASSFVRGLLEQSEPALQRMLQLVIAAKAAKGNVGAGMRETFDRVVDDLEDALALADGRTARAVRDLVQAAETVKPRRRQASGGAVRPPPRAVPTPGLVTRGSGQGKTRARVPAKGGKRG